MRDNYHYYKFIFQCLLNVRTIWKHLVERLQSFFLFQLFAYQLDRVLKDVNIDLCRINSKYHIVHCLRFHNAQSSFHTGVADQIRPVF